MHIPAELLPVLQITVPLLVGLFVAGWFQNKRIDDLRSDLGEFRTEVRTELRGIREELVRQGERLARLEERIPPPLVHR
jgi:hypothetical protein